MGAAPGSGMGEQGRRIDALAPPRVLLAQNMGGMGGAGATDGAPGPAAPRARLGGLGAMSDASPGPMSMGPMTPSPLSPMAEGPPNASPGSQPRGRSFIPLGQLADIRIVGGPPMVRDEGGLLVGYVYIDIDQQQRDIGGYVNEAKQVVQRAQETGEMKLPTGYFLKWTGQYEQLEEMVSRMRLVVPVTLMIVVVLLYLHFKNFIEVLIVLLSIPFALVGSVWLMYLLDYRLSTAVWVGIIALVGLAAQTGIVMIVYIDHAYERRKQAGKIRDLNDIIWAHMEGTVMRVRPKLMTVSTMLIGLVPLLWASGSGADVMKRIAAPMVGGLLTSAFLTLEIIPVIYTYWRQEEVLWERLAALDAARLGRMRRSAWLLATGCAALVTLSVVSVYAAIPRGPRWAGLGIAFAVLTGGMLLYFIDRPAARRLVWPQEETSR
jgi:hypothetical protein